MQILVLGNGFDIACQLQRETISPMSNEKISFKTTYDSFFKYYLSKMQVTPTENGKVFPSIMKILSRQSSVKFDVWFCIFSWHHDYGLLGNNGTWKDVETVISSFISPGNSHFPNINDYMDYDHLVFQRDFNSPFEREEVERTVDLYKCLDTYFNNTELHPFSDRESTWMFKRGVYDGLTEDSFHLQLGILELHRLFLRELEKTESWFEEYLGWLQSDDNSYRRYVSRSRKLFTNIKNAPFTSRIPDDDTALVLSFNYTRPLNISADQYANVHGDIE